MAVRQFKVPGKIINGTPAQVDRGVPGQFGLNTNSDSGLWITGANLNNEQDVTKFTMFFWYHPVATGSIEFFFIATDFAPGENASIRVLKDTTESLQVIFQDGINSTNLQFTSDAADFTVSAWNSVLISVDFSQLLVEDAARFYVNDTQLNNALLPSYNNAPIDFSRTGIEFNIFAGPGITPSADTQGYVSDVWMDFGTFIDFDITANRRKFIKSDKRPASLGALGQNPTGALPLVYFNNLSATYNVNHGSGVDWGFTSSTTHGTNNFTDDAGTDPATGTLA